MKLKTAKKTRSKIKKSNQLELTFLENPKNKKNENQNFSINNTINSISRIFLSSLIIVSFFYITPIIINFAEKNFYTKEFTNNSKKILAYTLNKENQNTEESEILKEEDLLLDIFSLNNLESDSVRLSASTIKQLFKETDYNLKDVRKTKLVKPVALTLLPQEIKMIENSKKKKRVFYSNRFTFNY